MARLLMILTYIAGGVGVAVGFYVLGQGSGHGEDALIAVTIGFCVVMGGLSWVRHFLLVVIAATALADAGVRPL